MKINTRDISGFLKKPEPYQMVLLYGPDEGLVRERSRVLLKKLVDDPEDPFGTTEIEASELKDNQSKLFEALSSVNLLGGSPVTLLRGASDKISKIINEASDAPECKNHLIMVAGELSPRSSLRKLAEKHKNIAAIACYPEEGYQLENTIKEKLNQAGIKYSREIISFISQSLGNDRGITNSEIEKIITYMGDDKNLTMEHAEQIINQNDSEGLDDLCNAIADGNSSKTNHLLQRITAEGYNSVAIIRAISRYFTRIHLARSEVDSGASMDSAMKTLKPPVFFKQQKSFARHVTRFNKPLISKILSSVNQAESDIKRALNPELICSRYLTIMAYQCRRKS